MKEYYCIENLKKDLDKGKAYRLMVRIEGRYHDEIESYFIVNNKAYRNYKDIFNVAYVLQSKPVRIPAGKKVFRYTLHELTDNKLYNYEQFIKKG